jgi:hypothetical protein
MGLQLDHPSASFFYWYAQLKKLEAPFDTGPVNQHLAKAQAEVERIEEAVSHIHFPLTFSDQLYNLRSHIRLNNWNVRFVPKAVSRAVGLWSSKSLRERTCWRHGGRESSRRYHLPSAYPHHMLRGQ